MFYEIAIQYQMPLKPYTLYPSITDTKAWSSLDQEWKNASITLGEKYLHFSYPSLSATDFMDFSRTGNRVRYENKCFAKRHALDALVLAECIENKGRFMDDIINGIFSICEESAWQLPPHNTYIRDTPQLPLPDSTAPILDLFTCETGAILATASYLLSSKLDQVSPFIRKRIEHELTERIYDPYCNQHFWWMGNGEEPMNNWTVWCTQNVLLSVFLLNTDSALKHAVIQKACKSIDFFLDEYGEDGCCDEGAQYYRHAGLCLFNSIELLNAVTNDAFAHLYDNAKIRNIAAYILNVHIEDKYYINFADCSPVAGRCSVREYLFAKRCGNADMAAFCAVDFISGMPETLTLPSENNLYYRLQNAFTITQIKCAASSHTGRIHHPDLYYQSVGIFLVRDDSLCLGVKSGDNADSHNHNDTGSFTIYKNGKPLFIDIGVESYTKKTFSPERYEIWTMQSAYHNLPTINGYMQKDGASYRARDVSYNLSGTFCEISMDIAPAYPAECGIHSYRRYARLQKRESIVIKDSFEPFACVVLSLMTYDKPMLQEEAATEATLFFTIGSLGSLRVSGASLLSIEPIPITDARLQTAWEHEVYRILLQATEKEVTMNIL